MFETICRLIPRDLHYPARARTLDILKRVLDGTLYDVLPHQFHEERGPGGEYIPLRNRRPSVRYALCRIVVEDSISLLFSEGHFPTIDCTDRTVRRSLADIVKETRLNLTMTEAAMRGSVGSVAILMRVLRSRVFFSVLDTTYLTAEWDPKEPDTLIRVTEKYKVSGAQLALNGYDLADQNVDYWFTRSWDVDSEIWFMPSPVGGGYGGIVDQRRTVRHGLGFVPIVWIRNLPGPSATADPADGGCMFRAAIETQSKSTTNLARLAAGSSIAATAPF